MLVAWNRITFPDGKIVDLGSMPGTDFAGQAGFKDQVNNHFLRLFGSALLMSAITAGINITPTLKVRPGYVLNVMVNKDLTFSKPYRNFDY
ncbi:MAG: hypothetical protein J6P47_03865 [Acetobacter sp.]|nr:hypothetical protein [Acetobacter sp.]